MHLSHFSLKTYNKMGSYNYGITVYTLTKCEEVLMFPFETLHTPLLFITCYHSALRPSLTKRCANARRETELLLNLLIPTVEPKTLNSSGGNAFEVNRKKDSKNRWLQPGTGPV